MGDRFTRFGIDEAAWKRYVVMLAFEDGDLACRDGQAINSYHREAICSWDEAVAIIRDK